MIGRRAILIGGAALALFALASPRARSGLAALGDDIASLGTGRLTVGTVKAMAERIGGTMGVDPLMIRAIVEIESARYPNAYRKEEHLDPPDASTGLMQPLLRTAQWVWDVNAAGIRQFVPNRPAGFGDLFDPETNMWIGTGYLKMLSVWAGRGRSREWVVRAYNGGPGGATASYTLPYYEKFLTAETRLTA